MITEHKTKKWNGILLQEQTPAKQKEKVIEKTKNIFKLDKEKWREIDLLIHEGMEYHSLLRFSLYRDEKLVGIFGRTIFIDYLSQEFRIIDKKENIHFVPFSTLVDVERL
ncbi:YolD-like family protein [Bacillus sp. B1-b2]|uniref:YolD-like family protein n=1 Tax=Bacillus sp. B1-b2 TaxID=2653201 RepID=UPI0012628D15|nr:YolD-like family protein [Bacillus sp. B1-b2]KAB7672240.1 YolD-like family protein [Bacillus sp. B1-b2]